MKAALIGCGWQGKRHVQALEELGIELACMIDIDPKAVAERFPDYPAEQISSNAVETLTKYHPDAVIIATNASARLENVRYCVDAGVKKIFLEKPMATSLKDAREMVQLTRDAGCQLVVNHLRRFSPNYQKLQETLKSGVIGPIQHMYAQAGSVGLGNEGTHIIDKMRLITNSDVEWVSGSIDTTGTPNPRGPQYKDPGGWGMLRFKDGTRAFIDTSEDTGVPPVWEIVGTYGRIIIEELNNNWTILARDEQDREIPLTKIPTPIKSRPVFDTLPWDVKEFTKMGLKEFILDNKVSCSGEDGLKALETIMGFHVSDQQGGARVSLPLNGDSENLEVAWA